MHAKQLWMIGLGWLVSCAASEDSEGAALQPPGAHVISDAAAARSEDAGLSPLPAESHAPVAGPDASSPGAEDAAVTARDGPRPGGL
jgi:hypothetical protein